MVTELGRKAVVCIEGTCTDQLPSLIETSLGQALFNIVVLNKEVHIQNNSWIDSFMALNSPTERTKEYRLIRA